MVEKKHAAINPINNDSICSNYAVTVALNNDIIGKDPKRTQKISPLIPK